MRKTILFALFVAMAFHAEASRRVSVAQLEETLAADDATHRTDVDAARQIADFEMAQRLTNSTLNRFASRFKLGPHTALALQLLADQSAFLDPPAAELPATESPDAESQQHMLDAARAYAVQTWSRMPNFFVTRVTNRFDDGAHVLAPGDWPAYLGLQLSGTTTRQIAFRDGKEVQDAAEQTTSDTAKPAQELGLRSWGEFGPALSVVLTDSLKQRIIFSHWEQTPTGIVAVFHYVVPRDASHYAVTYGYQSETVIGRTQFGYSGRNRSSQQVNNIPREKSLQTYSENPAYHGDISIDPANGAIMRLTIEAELSSGDPLLLAKTMVEYAPVAIGVRNFVCPAHSVAISMEQAQGTTGHIDRPGKKTTLLINETRFENYHRLGSSMRIVTDTASSSGATASPTSAGDAETPASPPPRQDAPVPTASNAVATPADKESESAPQVAANTTPPMPPLAPVAPVVPEISLGPAAALPDVPGGSAQETHGEFSLKVTSRLVNVGLVAYDKKSRPVTDLQAGDFEIYDNGRKQEIRSFTPAMTGAPAADTAPSAPAAPNQPDQTFSNRASDTPSASTAVSVSESGSTVLLIDESHIAWADMSNTRQQILKFLNSLKPGERVGIYSMNGLGFHVLEEVTTDHNALLARMQKFMPTAQSAAQAQEEETRNRQHFDEVHNAADLNSVNGNHIEVPDASTPIDPQLMTMGDDPVRASFIILAQVARHLSALPGQKKLVWVSSDNVLANWQDQSVGIEKSPKPIQGITMRAQEALNEAHAAIYPFDVSQLEVGGVSADLQHQNVQLTQAASDVAGLNGGPATSRSIGPGRIDAAMSQDLHPVQGPVRQIAAATGGRVLRRAGDLAGALEGIVADEHATYTLSFSPPGPADGQYHTISVKTGKRGLSLSYRTGYLFEKEAESLKDRFQLALWRPADANEIAVAASVKPGDGGSRVKINISAGDLGLQQQADRWMDKLDIFFIQRDDAGLHAHLEGNTLGLRLKSETYQRLMPAGVPFEHFVHLRPGTASLRVLVVDENTGHMGSVTIPVSFLHSGE